MKKFLFWLALTAGIAAGNVGCTLSGTSGSSNSSSVIESVFNSALSSAATILSSEGTQQLAIAAAEAYVAENVSDPSQQAAYNSLIEAAIPALAAQVASAASSQTASKAPGCDTRMSKGIKLSKAVRSSKSFASIVSDCVKKYPAELAKIRAAGKKK